MGEASDEDHHMVSHKATFGGRAIHSQSELDKMILKGEDGGRKRRKSGKESNIGEESHTR